MEVTRISTSFSSIGAVNSILTATDKCQTTWQHKTPSCSAERHSTVQFVFSDMSVWGDEKRIVQNVDARIEVRPSYFLTPVIKKCKSRYTKNDPSNRGRFPAVCRKRGKICVRSTPGHMCRAYTCANGSPRCLAETFKALVRWREV